MKNNKHSLKTILVIKGGYEIRADQMCWLVYTQSPRSYSYFTTLAEAINEILDLKIKEYAGNDSRKSLVSLRKAVTKAHQEIKQIIAALTTIKIPDQNRLEAFEGLRTQRDDQQVI